LYSFYGEDPGVISEIVSIVLREAPDNMHNLLNYCTSQEWDNLRNLAHKLTSSYGVVGALELKEVLNLIESACRNGKSNEITIRPLVEKATGLITRVTDELSREYLTL
jgi:HPt (histidine-containing phosphotransfer) domain-containing protein